MRLLKNKKFWLLLLLVILAGGYVANRFVKKKGFDSIFEFISVVSSNYFNSESPDIQLSLTVAAADWERMANVAQESLERGVIVQPKDNYVPVELEFEGEKIRAEIRIKGKMTDHVSGKKWSFRIKTKKGDAFMGMKRFSLQHPGTRNYIYEWLHQQWAAHEDFPHARYFFLQLNVNGENYGVYNLEEHFGQELMAYNEKKKGIVFRLEPDLYWSRRLNSHEGFQFDQEHTSYQSAKWDAFNEKSIQKDEALYADYQNVLVLMDAMRQGKAKVSEVLDIDKFARRYALLDLIGGWRSVDWSDIKFYYNPETHRVEPIAYESFSAFKIKDLIGDYKFSKRTIYHEFHDGLFSDEEFFRLYIQYLEKYSDKAYIDAFLAKIKPELEKNLRILNSEFPYKKFEPSIYYYNAEVIKRSLNIKKGFHAYLAQSESGTEVKIAPVTSLPIEVIAAKLDNKQEVKFDKPIVIESKAKGSALNYVQIQIHPEVKSKSVVLVYRILGSSKILQTEVYPYEYIDTYEVKNHYTGYEPNWQHFDFLYTDTALKTIHFKPGLVKIDSILVLPKGYTVVLSDKTALDFVKGSFVVSYATIKAAGTEENPLVITSSDKTGGGFLLIDSKESEFKHVNFSELSNPKRGNFSHTGVVNLYQSQALFNHCNFIGSMADKQLVASRSKLEIKNCTFLAGMDALKAIYSNLTVNQSHFLNQFDDALILVGSKAEVTNTKFSKTAGVAIDATEGSTVQLKNIEIYKVKKAIKAKDNTTVKGSGIKIRKVQTAYIADKKGDVFGPSAIELTDVELEKDERHPAQIEKSKKSTIQINGEELFKGKEIGKTEKKKK
jgi:hypothetical protein